MKPTISYLLTGFGHTGGSMVLYKFMDKLCERGYTVFAITPTERIQWQPNFSSKIIERFNPKNGLKNRLYDYGQKIVRRSQLLERIARKLLNRPVEPTIASVHKLTRDLVKNWVQSEITISTFCATSYANYALMDQTTPLYHMQHFEELFFNDKISRLIARLTYYLPLQLIANSIWLRNQIRERIGRDSYLLNPGIDTELFYPRISIREKYRNSKKIFITSYYSPTRLKGWDDAVEAMRIVFRELGNDRIEWTVFGGIPPKTPNIPIKFVGKLFNDSLAQLYSRAHIVFMNSWYESFPLPPLEAMACGTSVITTPIGTEDYAFDGKNSLVVPPRAPEELAEAILQLINEPSLGYSFAEAGVETARQFSWDKATDRLKEILHQAQDNTLKRKFADIPDLLAGNMSGLWKV